MTCTFRFYRFTINFLPTFFARSFSIERLIELGMTYLLTTKVDKLHTISNSWITFTIIHETMLNSLRDIYVKHETMLNSLRDKFN